MNKQLIQIFRAAYAPCDGLKNRCKNHIQWDPYNGHMPRGYMCNANDLEKIQLVLVLAEPGNPEPGDECYTIDTPENMITAHNSYVTFSGGGLFHQNIRKIVSLCFPELDFATAKKKVLITESVLCSTPITQTSTGRMPIAVVDECGERYLLKQHELLKNAYWVAVGAKARDRMKRLGIPYNFVISHPAPPEANKSRALHSWQKMAADFQTVEK